MSQPEVYQEIKGYLEQYLVPGIGQRTLDRVTLLASGILKAQHGAPAKIAEAGKGLSDRGVQADSVERRIRRIENDDKIQVSTLTNEKQCDMICPARRVRKERPCHNQKYIKKSKAT